MDYENPDLRPPLPSMSSHSRSSRSPLSSNGAGRAYINPNRIDDMLLSSLKGKTYAAKFLLLKNNMGPLLVASPSPGESRSPIPDFGTTPYSLAKIGNDYHYYYSEHPMTKLANYFLKIYLRSTPAERSPLISRLHTRVVEERIYLSRAEVKTLVDNGHYFSDTGWAQDMTMGFMFAEVVDYCIKVSTETNNPTLLPLLLSAAMIILYPLFQRAYFIVAKGISPASLNHQDPRIPVHDVIALLFGLTATTAASNYLSPELGPLAAGPGAAAFVLADKLWVLITSNQTPKFNDILDIVKKTLPLSVVFGILLYCEELIKHTSLNEIESKAANGLLFTLGLPILKEVAKYSIETISPFLWHIITYAIIFLRNFFRNSTPQNPRTNF